MTGLAVTVPMITELAQSRPTGEDAAALGVINSGVSDFEGKFNRARVWISELPFFTGPSRTRRPDGVELTLVSRFSPVFVGNNGDKDEFETVIAELKRGVALGVDDGGTNAVDDGAEIRDVPKLVANNDIFFLLD